MLLRGRGVYLVNISLTESKDIEVFARKTRSEMIKKATKETDIGKQCLPVFLFCECVILLRRSQIPENPVSGNPEILEVNFGSTCPGFRLPKMWI